MNTLSAITRVLGAFASELEWSRPWSKVLDWTNPPYAKWFVGGRINASVNLCRQAHQRAPPQQGRDHLGRGPGDRRTLTYFDLYRQVSAFANVLRSLGVKKGDRIAIYMPLVPTGHRHACLCPRGCPAQHRVRRISAESLRDRINDAHDAAHHRPRISARFNRSASEVSVEAVQDTPSIEHVVMLRRMTGAGSELPAKWHDWHELMSKAPLECAAEPMDSEDLLYILYTSGTTGKPKGIMHTTGGYLTGTYATSKWVFDLKEEMCTGARRHRWVTGHS